MPREPLPRRSNLLLASLVLALHGWLISAAVRGDPAVWLAALLCLTTTPMLWALIHEGIHGHLLGSRRGSDALSRLLSIAFGAPFAPLRFTHLLHHRCNRTRLDRPDVHDPAQGSYARHALAHFARLAGGQFYAEVSLSLLAWCPRRLLRAFAAQRFAQEPEQAAALARWAERDLLDRPSLSAWRLDALVILILWVSVFAVAAPPAMPALLVLLALRALLVSTLDNAFHHGTALDVRRDIRSLQTTRAAAALMLNFNLHRTHHANPSLPWNALPHHADIEPADPGLVRGLVRQWRGPVPIARLPSVPG